MLPDSGLTDPHRRLLASLFLATALSISSVKIVAAVVREVDFLRRKSILIHLVSSRWSFLFKQSFSQPSF